MRQPYAGMIMLDANEIKELGVLEAVIYKYLSAIYRDKYNSELIVDDMIPCSIAFIEQELGIKEKRQRSAIQHLVECGLLEVKIIGLPAKRYFKVYPKHDGGLQ